MLAKYLPLIMIRMCKICQLNISLWSLQSSESISYTLVAAICIVFMEANQISIVACVIELTISNTVSGSPVTRKEP